MARTCGSCGRAWPSAAAFCGACGALLDPSVAARPDTTRIGRVSSIRRRLARPAVAWAGTVAVVVATVVAVPALTVERTPPVDGAIDVPEGDELQAAPAAVPPSPRAPAPEVTCEVDAAPVPCVRWSRELLPPEDLQRGWSAWSTVVGDRVLVSSPRGLEMIDPVDGTRRWRVPVDDLPELVDADDDVAVVGMGGEMTVLDLEEGTPRWASRARPITWGDVLVEDVVVLADTPAVLVGHDRADGRPRWRWDAPWQDGFGLRDLGEGRLLVLSGGARGMAVLDARTGEELAVTDAETGWLLGLSHDVAVTARTAPRHRPGRAGDPGATLVGLDLDDLSIRWEQDVPSSDVSFGLVDGVVLAPSARLLTALDARSGQVAWELELPSTSEVAMHADGWFVGLDPVRPRVVVTRDLSDELVRGHDPATGAVLWDHRTSGSPEYVFVGGQGVVVHARGAVAVLDADSGRERVQIRTPADASLLGLDPAIVAHSSSGHLVGLDLP